MRLQFTDKPSILLLHTGYVGADIFSYLLTEKENVTGCSSISDYDLLKHVTEQKPDLIITCYWPAILKPEVFKVPKYGCINFHPALLPQDRGWYPAVWQILRGGKAGVTLHLIDEGADTGPILAQKSFLIKETDTGGDVYYRSQNTMIELFKEIWGKLYNEGIEVVPQVGEGSYHSKKEGNAIDEIYLTDYVVTEDLLKRLKAKTFSDRSYAFYRKNGKKYFVSIKVTESNE